MCMSFRSFAMKHATIIFVVAVLVFVAASSACGGGGGSTPSPTPSATPTPTPTPNQPRTGDLLDATRIGDIAYELEGVENDNIRTMYVTVRNKSERIWEVKIEVGTKFEPKDDDVQQMVVVKEVKVELEPHEHNKLKVEVSCLDIHKGPPPPGREANWRLERSDKLARFINCAWDEVKIVPQEGDE